MQRVNKRLIVSVISEKKNLTLLLFINSYLFSALYDTEGAIKNQNETPKLTVSVLSSMITTKHQTHELHY